MTFQEKKVDAKELAAALERLPEEEKLKIFYMIKGIELVRLDKVTAQGFIDLQMIGDSVQRKGGEGMEDNKEF